MRSLIIQNLAHNPRQSPRAFVKTLGALCASVAIVVAISGCVNLKVSTPEQHYYTLESSATIQSRLKVESKDQCPSLTTLRLEIEIPTYINTQQILLHTTSGELTPLPDTKLLGLPAELMAQALQARAVDTCTLLSPLATTPMTLRVRLRDMGIIEDEKVAFISMDYMLFLGQEIHEGNTFTITNDVINEGRAWNTHGQILALQGAFDYALDSIIRQMQRDIKAYKPKK